jgi:hypothetical protein
MRCVFRLACGAGEENTWFTAFLTPGLYSRETWLRQPILPFCYSRAATFALKGASYIMGFLDFTEGTPMAVK